MRVVELAETFSSSRAGSSTAPKRWPTRFTWSLNTGDVKNERTVDNPERL